MSEERKERKCKRCGVVDRASVIPREFDIEGRPLLSHTVKVDMVYLRREEITAKEKAQGWEFMRFEGKPAMVIFLCEPCINRQEDTHEVWKSLKQTARELETGNRDRTVAQTLFN